MKATTQFNKFSSFSQATIIIMALLFFGFILTISEKTENGSVIEEINRWSPLSGVWIGVFSGIIVILFVLIEQNRPRKNYITSYRKAEEYFIYTKNNNFDFNSLMCYHREYNWSLYAGIFISAALLAAAFSYNIDYVKARNLAFVSCTSMAVGGALIAVVELVHTNTLTPLVPTPSRFRIVNLCIIFGGFGVTLSICAVISFIAILSPLASLIAGFSFIAVIIFLTGQRVLLKEEIVNAFGLNDSQWTELMEFSAGRLEAMQLEKYTKKRTNKS